MMKSTHSYEENTPVHRYRTANRLLAVIVLALILVIGYMLLRPSLPGDPPPLPPGPPHPPGAEQPRVTEGVVKGYASNIHVDINAIRVATFSNGLITVAFRPHTARAVMQVASPDDTVTISYRAHPDDESVGYQLHTVRNIRTGAYVNVDDLPTPPRVPPGQSADHFTIRSPQLITDPYGGIAAIRSDHNLFHFKPGQVDDISPLIRNSKTLSVLAVLRSVRTGFVNAEHDSVYIVISITADNQTFLIR